MTPHLLEQPCPYSYNVTVAYLIPAGFSETFAAQHDFSIYRFLNDSLKSKPNVLIIIIFVRLLRIRGPTIYSPRKSTNHSV